MFAIIDPFDAPMLNTLRDRLGAVCFCAERPWQAPFCPVHNPHKLVSLIQAEQETVEELEARIEELEEEAKEASEQRVEDDQSHNAQVAGLEDQVKQAEAEAAEKAGALDKAEEALEVAREEIRKLRGPTLVKS